MIISRTVLELLFYFIIYSFWGWMVEVAIIAIKERRFRNRGFVSLPFCIMYGIIMNILVILWPNLHDHYIFKFVVAFIVFIVVQSITETLTERICHRMLLKYEDITPYNGQWKNLMVAILFAAGLCGMAELVHPFVFWAAKYIPTYVITIVCVVVFGAISIDFLVTLYILSKNRRKQTVSSYQQKNQEIQSCLNERIYNRIWNRLDKAYPNIEVQSAETYIFARGLCLDKVIWVFLVSALLGDIIETIYCRAIGGEWMSRSSVLYGPFSIVWGIGAVVLTLVLSRFAQKSNRYIFLIGALIGGVYEYICSLFTEIVFGCVFWDYSRMPCNIGGRTNLLYMFLGGILAVVWIKGIYPHMSRAIERLPALQGKIITWVLILFMICNALLSSMAMIRYSQRQDGMEARNAVEKFLDATYEDTVIEKVWPNMKRK